MSCIRFNTETQRHQFRFADCEAESVSAFTSPKITEGKLTHIKEMVKNKDFVIRAAAAASPHLPDAEAWLLINDKHDEVRCWLARNEWVDGNVLDALSHDKSERVRSFVAVNRKTPERTVNSLINDTAEGVRKLAKWRLQFL